ncbi:MAG: D-alanyl-D-alanine carboxypeptidase family protein [Lachnospiraceae bacterium]
MKHINRRSGLNMIRRPAITLLMTSILLCGCTGGERADLQYPVERMDTYLVSDSGLQIAEMFTKELCVITGTEESEDSRINAQAAGLFGVDDQTVMFQKNPFERMYPASITKVMTALVTLKYADLQDKVTVGDEVIITEAGASMCNIKPGDTLTVEQLLYGLMLPSGNDAGNALAVHISGSVEAFSDLMNQEARRIGATNSHFLNPHGLHDENHYTTVYDLYLIFHEALKSPEFRTLISTTGYTATYIDSEGNPASQTWANSNRYLTGERQAPDGVYVIGGKTGTTNAAGYCLIMASEDADQNQFISVILKAGSRPDLYDNMTNIIQKIVN